MRLLPHSLLGAAALAMVATATPAAAFPDGPIEFVIGKRRPDVCRSRCARLRHLFEKVAHQAAKCVLK